METIKPKGDGSLIIEFPSWEDFIRNTRPYKHFVPGRLTTGTYGAGANEDVADRMADQGWLEGADMARAFYDAHVEVLGSMIERPEMFYDVEGTVADIGRISVGEPECVMNFQNVLASSPSPKFFRIVVNVGASGGIPAASMLARGGVLCALVDLMEMAGIRCEVAIVDAVRDLSRWYCSTVTVKQFDEPLDLPMVAYAIGHPSVLRHHVFRLYERMGIEYGQVWRTVGYGAPADVPAEQRGDLYAGRMHYSDEQWRTPELARAWIIEQMKAAGVTLKAYAQEEHRA